MSGLEASEKALGVAIQQARQASGLTQQELCNRADLSYSTLAKIERGAIKTPSVFTVARIASILGVTLDQLVGNDAHAAVSSHKKTSKSGISFVYVDINGCLVHFFHAAFSKLAAESGVSSEVIESTFWHYNDAVCRGEMSMDDFNDTLARTLNMANIHFADYYMEAVEPIKEMHDLVRWASQDFKVGLLSNIMPGFITEMIQRGLLPDVAYDAIIDSSVVGAIKPEEAVYRIAEKQAGVPSEQILFIDDSRANVMSAERLGWKVLWFDDMRPAESVTKIRSALEL